MIEPEVWIVSCPDLLGCPMSLALRPFLYSVGMTTLLFAATYEGKPIAIATAQTAVSSIAHQAMLSPTQVDSLMTVGIPIAVPTDIPEDFATDVVEVTPLWADGSNLMKVGYRILYRQTTTAPLAIAPACFEIEAVLGGLGGPVPNNAIAAALPDFAQPSAEQPYQVFWSDGGTLEGPFPEPVLFSDWIAGEDAFYRISSGMTERCTLISPETANRILASLHYLPLPR